MKLTDVTLLRKYNQLKEYLSSMNSAAVAFSGGVDSSFLLHAAKEALGDKVIAVTASSYLFPDQELEEAELFCRSENVRQIIVKSEELKINGFADNPPNRCYLCKRELLKKIIMIAEQEGMKEVVEGSNLDDEGDYRPGMAAISELTVKSPLRYISFTKNEIRILSRELSLPTWDKPSFACLASRFPYGEEISKEKLEMVGDAEKLLRNLGFNQLRVRIHGKVARIELEPQDFSRFLEEKTRLMVDRELKRMGFSYVSLDILGYRTGSMNEGMLQE